jgi:hypothetical protein
VALRPHPLRGGAAPGDPPELMRAMCNNAVVLKSAKQKGLTSVEHGVVVNARHSTKSLLINDAAPALDITSPL